MRRLFALLLLLMAMIPSCAAAAEEPESRVTYLYVTACQSLSLIHI